MAREGFWCLRQAHIFEGLSERELQELSRIAPMRHFPQGRFIYHMGEPVRTLYIIGEGEVVISTVTREGKELILGVLGSGDVFGELFAPKEDTGMTEAKAHTDVWLCALTERDFLGLCMRHPEVAISFIRVLMHRVYELQEKVEDLAYSTAHERLLKLFYRLCVEDRNRDEASPCVVRFSQEELACMLGLTREYVNAVLRKWKGQGILEVRYGHLILDRERLSRFYSRGHAGEKGHYPSFGRANAATR